jgi:hypothetical protein
LKIFNVSLHRSGTRSFHVFCEQNGFRSLHWLGLDFDGNCAMALEREDRRALWGIYSMFINQSDACSDVPCPSIYEEAFEAFPNAKFILVLRRPSEWIASVRRHTAGRALGVLEKFMYWPLATERRDTLSEYSDSELEDCYVRHTANVANFMIARRAHFSVFQLDDPLIGQRLAKFLGVNESTRMPRIREEPRSGE